MTKDMVKLSETPRRLKEMYGVAPALAKLPKNRRAQFRMALKGSAVNWWTPGVMWEGWQPLLEQLELVNTPNA